MNKLELYDVLTLKDNKEYCVLRMYEELDNLYLLLAEIDSNEELTDNYRIVKQVIDNNQMFIENINDPEKINKLKEIFIPMLKMDM